MSTAAKIAANQANAQHSTGPRTPEGKAASSQNAVSHGLRSCQSVVHPREANEYTAMREGMIADICPHGALQLALFEQLLHAAWNQRRFRLLEAHAASQTLTGELTPHEADARMKTLVRYYRTATRDFNRAMSEIRRLQTEQAFREASAAGREEPGPSKGLTDTVLVRRLLRAARRNADLTERTQQSDLPVSSFTERTQPAPAATSVVTAKAA